MADRVPICQGLVPSLAGLTTTKLHNLTDQASANILGYCLQKKSPGMAAQPVKHPDQAVNEYLLRHEKASSIYSPLSSPKSPTCDSSNTQVSSYINSNSYPAISTASLEQHFSFFSRHLSRPNNSRSAPSFSVWAKTGAKKCGFYLYNNLRWANPTLL